MALQYAFAYNRSQSMGWAAEEMATSCFGDGRLDKRAAVVLEGLTAEPQSSIPTAFDDWHATKAAYRFFGNKKVTLEKVITPHIDKTIERIQLEKRVFMVQDTTEINYTSQQCKQDVGPSHHEKEKIVFLHPTIAVTPNKVCLGLTSMQYWHRDKICVGKSKEKDALRKQLPIEEKESYRWLKGYRHATKVAQQCPDTHIIMLADRESDISDLYVEAEQTTGIKADWIVRAKSANRSILKANGMQEKEALQDKLLKQKPIAVIKFELPHRSAQNKRIVTQEVRTIRAELCPPGRSAANKLAPFWVTAVLATEIKVPSGVKPIQWLIFTNIELNTEIKGQDILSWYLCRWQIEVFFYTLKSGCAVEELQLTTGDRFMPCIGMYCIAAWRILLLTYLSRVQPNINVEVLFNKLEWQYAYAKVYKKAPPKTPITLGVMVALVAKLGGFLARKSDGSPGPKTIWRGMRKLNNFIEAEEIHFLVQNCG